MSLPEKEYFTLSEMSDRWGAPLHNLQYYAEHGMLEMQAWFAEVVVKLFNHKRTEDGQVVEAPTGLSSHKGYAVIGTEELRKVFRYTGKPVIRKFKSAANDDVMELFDKHALIPLSIDDLVISRTERDRFEMVYELDCCCERAARAADPNCAPSFPGRPSVMFKVLEHFRDRSNNMQVFASLSQEADYLAKWAEANIRDAQAPKVKTIKNNLRDSYRQHVEKLSGSNNSAIPEVA